MHARLLASLVVTLVAVFNGCPPASGVAVKITKIQYDPPGIDTHKNSSLNKEFVVLKNIGSRTVTLTGWRLEDKGEWHVYTFDTVRLGAGKSVTIHTGIGNDDRNDLYWNWGFGDIWGNDGDTATLELPYGNRVDQCHYSGRGMAMNC
jgi:hypothetical protein